MVEVKCAECGKLVRTYPSRVKRSKEIFCSKACHMAKMNRELNPTRMTPEIRAKLSLLRRGSGDQKTYEKLNGKHLHRAVAEQKLGRKLLPGEVVHHINGNKRDNRPENIVVFSSQAEHAKWHAMLNRGEVMPDEVHAVRIPEESHQDGRRE